MKLLFAALIAFSADYAADDVKAQQGTWQFVASKSDWSNKPGGAPREATIAITDNGWTYTSTDSSGKKTDLRFDKQTNTIAGNDKLSIKYEQTGNPNLSDMRVCYKATGQEIERVVTAAVPDGEVLLIYGSGIAADGKRWYDFSYFNKVR